MEKKNCTIRFTELHYISYFSLSIGVNSALFMNFYFRTGCGSFLPPVADVTDSRCPPRREEPSCGGRCENVKNTCAHLLVTHKSGGVSLDLGLEFGRADGLTAGQRPHGLYQLGKFLTGGGKTQVTQRKRDRRRETGKPTVLRHIDIFKGRFNSES